MPVIETLAKVLLALAVVLFVGYPLLKQQWGEDEPVLSEESEELFRRKESTFSALKELEFDYKTGKLSEQDYRELETRYKAEALEILEAIDELDRAEKKGKRGKAAAQRAATGAAGPGRPASGARTPREITSAEACVSCGRVNPPGSRFCAACGDALDAQRPAPAVGGPQDAVAAVCGSCGSELAPGHHFCGSCGSPVQA